MREQTPYDGSWGANAQLALDTINMRPTRGIPTSSGNCMQWSHIETLSGNPPGSYPDNPEQVYLDYRLRTGTCYIDQWIPKNPLSMKDRGFTSDTNREATTGAETIVRDGLVIDSPKAAVEHMEKFVFPHYLRWKKELQANIEAEVAKRIAAEVTVQELFAFFEVN
ncbi:MAG: hypothetical protein GX230_09775 [Lentisphaerae bacterium]|jgi:hypothetical protein|nr:hypothetical protein [Lentisphaerota bacterium]